MDEPKACTSCRFHHHLVLAVGDPGIHLCTVQLALPEEQHPDEPSRDTQWESEFVGWNCDRCRRMGELCGPSGRLWSAQA